MKVFIILKVFLQTMLIWFLSQSVQALQSDDHFKSENLLVQYTEKNPQIRSSGHNTTIKIYRDGRVLVSMPESMKKSGYYHAQLVQNEFDTLLKLLTNEIILTFDASTIQKLLNEERWLSRTSQDVLISVSDKAEVTFVCYPNRYWSTQLVEGDGDAVKRITWSGLRWDAERYSHIEPIRLLSEIQQLMLSILDRDDLQSVGY